MLKAAAGEQRQGGKGEDAEERYAQNEESPELRGCLMGIFWRGKFLGSCGLSVFNQIQSRLAALHGFCRKVAVEGCELPAMGGSQRQQIGIGDLSRSSAGGLRGL
jgi:hypothetical protein